MGTNEIPKEGGGEVFCLSSIISWGEVSKTTIEPSLRSRRMSYSVHVQTSALKKAMMGLPNTMTLLALHTLHSGSKFPSHSIRKWIYIVFLFS